MANRQFDGKYTYISIQLANFHPAVTLFICRGNIAHMMLDLRSCEGARFRSGLICQLLSKYNVSLLQQIDNNATYIGLVIGLLLA